MDKKTILIILSIFVLFAFSSEYLSNQNINENDDDIEITETIEFVELTTIEETTFKKKNKKKKDKIEITTKERKESKSDYKNKCSELYYDDIFDKEPYLGEYVKINSFVAEKYNYTSSSIEGILVEDITNKYDLIMKCIGCCVMHEETKDSAVPSYFGKQYYLMFTKNMESKFDKIKTGNKIVVYGEVIQNKNGIYVLPKYIE